MKRPDDVVGYVEPWCEYADWLEAQNLGLIQSLRELEAKIAKDREAMRAVVDKGQYLPLMRHSETRQDVDDWRDALYALAKRLEE